MTSAGFMTATERLICMIRPLRLVGVGLLLVAFDFSINRLDLLHDAVGYVLIALGAAYLAPLMLRPRDAIVMKLVVLLAGVGVLRETLLPLLPRIPLALEIPVTAAALTEPVLTVLFVQSILFICEAAGAGRATRAWRQTLVLTVVLYAIPLGLLALAGLAAWIAGEPGVHINLGPGKVWLLLPLLVPIMCYFVAIHVTKQHVRALEQQRWLPVDERHCLACGYPLRGLEGERCPECGGASRQGACGSRPRTGQWPVDFPRERAALGRGRGIAG